MKHFILFILALLFSGTMGLGDVSKEFSQILTIPNAVEVDGSQFKIAQPEIIMPNSPKESISFEISSSNTVLPIPKNMVGSHILLAPGINIVNNMPHAIKIESDTLIPELIRVDGQVLQPQVDKHSQSRESKCILIEPRMNAIFAIEAKLFWQNNKLQFSGTSVGGSWFFEDIQSGTYKIQFTYRRSLGGFSCSEKETQILTKEENWVKQGDTRSVTLRLVKPVATDPSAVELDGVLFKTVISQPVLTIPENKPNVATDVQLGMLLINNTLKPIRVPQNPPKAGLERLDGGELRGGCLSDSLSRPQKFEEVIVKPGESIELLVNGKLLWANKNLRIIMSDSPLDFCFYDELMPGNYQFSLWYNIPNTEIYSEDSFTERISRLQDIWTGLVVTPFGKFRLVEQLT